MASLVELKGNVKLSENTGSALTLYKPITPAYTYPIAAGNIGEVVIGTLIPADGEAFANQTIKIYSTISLTKGNWIVSGFMHATFPSLTTMTFLLVFIEMSGTTNAHGLIQEANTYTNNTGTELGISRVVTALINITESMTASLKTQFTFSGTSPKVFTYFPFQFKAVRVG